MLGAIVFLVVANWPQSRRQAHAVDVANTTLRLDGGYGPRFAGEMLAQWRGQRDGHRSPFNVQAVRDDPAFVHNVVRDHAIGVTTGQKFLLAAWGGEPIVAFGASLLDTPIVIVTLQRSGLRYPKDLVGKRLSYRANTAESVVFDALVAQLGLPRSQLANVAVPDKFDALRRGEVDAIVAEIDDPGLQTVEPAPRFNIIKLQDYGIHVPGLVYFAGADLVRDNPSVIQQALQSVILGWQDVYDDLDKNVPVIVSLDPARLTPAGMRFGLAQLRDLVRPTGVRIGYFDESRWNTLRDILLFARVGEQSDSLSVNVTYQFLRDVYRKPLNLDAVRGGAFGN